MYEVTAEQLIYDLKNQSNHAKNGKDWLPLRELKITKLTVDQFKSILEAICKKDLSEIITKLDVSDNALQKLPKVIGILNKLKMLNVSHNELQEIPEFNDCLPELEGFDASHNRLQALPGSMYGLAKLRSVNVDNNPLEANTIQAIQARWPQAEQKSVLDTPGSMHSSLAILDSNAEHPEPIPSVNFRGFRGLSFSEKYPADTKVEKGDAKLTPETTEQRRDSDILKDIPKSTSVGCCRIV